MEAAMKAAAQASRDNVDALSRLPGRSSSRTFIQDATFAYALERAQTAANLALRRTPRATWLSSAPPLLLGVDTDAAAPDARRWESDARGLGWDTLLVGDGAQWHGSRTKIALAASVLARQPPQRLVVLADVRDVVLVRGPAEAAVAFTRATGVCPGGDDAVGGGHVGRAPLLLSAEQFAQGGLAFDARVEARGGYVQVADHAPYWAAHAAWEDDAVAADDDDDAAAAPATSVAPAADEASAYDAPLMRAWRERLPARGAGGAPWDGDGTPARQYVNGGLVMARAADLLGCLGWMMATNATDDQRAYGTYAATHPSRVVVDWAAAVLHSSGYAVSCAGLSPAQLLDAPSWGAWLGNQCVALHVPGVNLPQQGVLWRGLCGAARPHEMQADALARRKAYLVSRSSSAEERAHWEALTRGDIATDVGEWVKWACATAPLYAERPRATDVMRPFHFRLGPMDDVFVR